MAMSTRASGRGTTRRGRDVSHTPLGLSRFFLAYQHHPFQDGFWVADCLKCSVLTQRGSNQSNPDPDKFSYVDIKDSGYLPLLGLQVNQYPSLCIRTIYNVIVITKKTIRIQGDFYARQSRKPRERLQFFLLTDLLLIRVISFPNLYN